jgi:hypothetical protein
MPDLVVSSEVLTSAAPLETNISVDHQETDIIVLDGDYCDHPLDVILAPYLEGCGRVDLLKIEAKIVTTDARQKVMMGFAATGSSISVAQAAGKLSGLLFVSNAKTQGDEVTKVLVPEDTLSRQIRPNSADLPMLKLMVDVNPEVMLFLHIYIKVRGVRVRYGKLPTRAVPGAPGKARVI